MSKAILLTHFCVALMGVTLVRRRMMNLTSTLEGREVQVKSTEKELLSSSSR